MNTVYIVKQYEKHTSHAQNKTCMQLPRLTSYSLCLFSGLTDVQAC